MMTAGFTEFNPLIFNLKKLDEFIECICFI